MVILLFFLIESVEKEIKNIIISDNIYEEI